jgi:hypothetical protein
MAKGYTISFQNLLTGQKTMPCVVVTNTGTHVGATASYNEFNSKDDARKFIQAQRTIAKHLGMLRKFEDELANHQLVAETVYTRKLGKL